MLKGSSAFKQVQYGDSNSYDLIAHFVMDHSGINLLTGKEFLIETRLSRRVHELNLKSLLEYYEYLKTNENEQQNCIELLTTHKTEWFREIVHFQWLKQQVPEILKKQKEIKIWSAACSSGLEVYSLMFLLLKCGLKPEQFKILGTDISEKILQQAVDIPNTPDFKSQFLFLQRQCPEITDLASKVNQSIEKSIKFRQFNLIESNLTSAVNFDVIFLRNVLIYFDRPTVNLVCKRLSRYLKPEGHLIIGLSESLQGQVEEFKHIGQAIYKFQKKGEP